MAWLNLKSKNLLTYEQLSKTPFEKPIEINSNGLIVGSYFRVKNFDLKGAITFKVKLNKGQFLSNYIHNCIKKVLIYEGTIYEYTLGKQFEVLEDFSVKPKDNCKIKALEPSTLYIEFKNPNKK